MFILSKLFAILDFPEEIQIRKDHAFSTLAILESHDQKQYATFLENASYAHLVNNDIALLITTPSLAPQYETANFGLVVTNNPKRLFFMLHNAMASNNEYCRQVFDTKIGNGCNISKLASIAEKNVIIGDHVTIEEFVIIRENTTVGDHTIIRAGSVIGGQGFQILKMPNSLISVAHLGGTVIGSHVEIKYNSCVDRAIYTWDDTIIADQCKFDNLIHVGHGAKIGANTMVVAGVGLGGRVAIGEECWFGLGANVRNGITIGDKARVNMGAVATRDMLQGESVTGNFAIPHNRFMANLKKSLQQDL